VVDAILSGLRVVEVSAFVAAPLAGATLASLGAEVIRVEQLGGGVDARRWPLHDGRSLFRAGLDRGKRSVALDLRSERGQELVKRLVAAPGDDGGILVTNLDSSGWMAYERLLEHRPDLIMVVIGGTPDDRVAVDYTVNAGLGFPWVTGPEEHETPVNHVLPSWDIATGLLAATSVLAAERHRRKTGEGQLVRLALSEVALAITGHLGYVGEALLTDEPRGRFGNDVYGTYGRDFRTRDGRYVMVVALTPRQWRCLAEATDLVSAFLAIEEEHGVELADESERFAHREKVSALVARWVNDRSFEEVRTAFDRAGVVWGPYRTFKELVRDEPLATQPHASPVAFGSHHREPAPPSPPIGADTESVLVDLLRLSADDVDDLRTAGVIS
jgi:2-methylfumaryl-CoA isomerase